MTQSFSSTSVSAPSLALFSLEPLRAAIEYSRMLFMDKAALPSGDGHPVVLFPGLAADHRSLDPLRKFCEHLGYATYDWGRGFNTGPEGDVDAWIDELALHVDSLIPSRTQSISLVGWSLGGIYAREVAKKLPGRVRHVITIGTPFAGMVEQTNVSWLYHMLNKDQPPPDAALAARLRTPPKVPTTSIFSKSDGMVAWQACCQNGGATHTENVEVKGSHFGLGWNPEVFAVVADRLRQPQGAWQPYTHSSVQV
jgi:predicted alpha/beta hydrolase family esterase